MCLPPEFDQNCVLDCLDVARGEFSRLSGKTAFEAGTMLPETRSERLLAPFRWIGSIWIDQAQTQLVERRGPGDQFTQLSGVYH